MSKGEESQLAGARACGLPITQTIRTMTYQALIKAAERDPDKFARMTAVLYMILEKSKTFHGIAKEREGVGEVLMRKLRGKPASSYYFNLQTAMKELAQGFMGGPLPGSGNVFAECFCIELELYCKIELTKIDAAVLAEGVNMLIFPLLGPAFKQLAAMGSGLAAPTVFHHTIPALDGSGLINKGESALKAVESTVLKKAFKAVFDDGTAPVGLGSRAEAAPESKDDSLWGKIKRVVIELARDAASALKTKVSKAVGTWYLDPENDPLAYAKCLCDYMLNAQWSDEEGEWKEPLKVARQMVNEEFGNMALLQETAQRAGSERRRGRCVHGTTCKTSISRGGR